MTHPYLLKRGTITPCPSSTCGINSGDHASGMTSELILLLPLTEAISGVVRPILRKRLKQAGGRLIFSRRAGSLVLRSSFYVHREGEMKDGAVG